jgi:hypothetical protein
MPVPASISILKRCGRGLWRIDRDERRHGAGIGHQRRRLCHDRPERAFVIDEFVEHAPDRFLCGIGTGIAHVVVLEVSADHRNAGLLTNLLGRNDTGIGLEDWILGTERKDLEPAVGGEGHAQIVEGHA